MSEAKMYKCEECVKNDPCFCSPISQSNIKPDHCLSSASGPKSNWKLTKEYEITKHRFDAIVTTS